LVLYYSITGSCYNVDWSLWGPKVMFRGSWILYQNHQNMMICLLF